ncbi:orofacial cleft 1 candidate gene 1 protein homolog [Candoia aspera]|uniref:orofacial cleft 1 candidate gene 1 protein homolog n=1 Tax=Candoia aspera TaxID=51853 RepID=UPI002FD80C07
MVSTSAMQNLPEHSFIHLTISLQKFQQKALKQTKQKKSKSSDFLMAELCSMTKDEKVPTEGYENPAFTGISTHQTYKVGLIRHDKLTSSLGAHQQKLRLRAQADPRGNECSRNYFDPLMDEEINPRQCGMEVSKEALTKSDERFLYDKLVQFLDEEKKMMVSREMKVEERDDEDTLDSARPVSCSKTSDLCDEVADEDILPYIQQFEKEVHDEVILLGNFPFKQVRVEYQ